MGLSAFDTQPHNFLTHPRPEPLIASGDAQSDGNRLGRLQDYDKKSKHDAVLGTFPANVAAPVNRPNERNTDAESF